MALRWSNILQSAGCRYCHRCWLHMFRAVVGRLKQALVGMPIYLSAGLV
jgi:hypothetical protein